MHQKLSEGIADIYTIKEITDDFSFDDYDIIAVGYWLTRGGPDMQVQKLLKRLENKHVVFFQTQTYRIRYLSVHLLLFSCIFFLISLRKGVKIGFKLLDS